MFKKILFALTAILAFELVVIGILWSSFESAPHYPATVSAGQTQTRGTELVLPESITLVFQDKKFTWPQERLSTLLDLQPIWLSDQTGLVSHFVKAVNPNARLENELTEKKIRFREEALGTDLLELAATLNREAENAELEIENDRVVKFRPHAFGQDLDLAATRAMIGNAILNQAREISLPIHSTPPAVKLENLNALGIRDLLARGQSDFTGSSAARIQNIRVGSSQYNGLIIKPGEEFSFNEHLGPIDAAHGYKPELVIKPEGATPEFGGGLCQVSTTAFRAAFFGGLPITQRRNHSYAVRYYEWISDDRPRAVGLDATIYSGVQDMKFINDTGAAILIWTSMEGKRLYFDFYGTPDGREVIVDGPHPYDRRASGAVKSKVTRIVKKPGQDPVELTYDSKYVPPKTLPAVVEYPKPPETVPPPPTPEIQTQ